MKGGGEREGGASHLAMPEHSPSELSAPAALVAGNSLSSELNKCHQFFFIDRLKTGLNEKYS
jgi:hypothetical protein